MSLPIDSAFNQAPVVLTPPSGVRRASSDRGSQRRRRKKRRLGDVLRADPTPWHLIVAAVFYWATPSIVAHLQNTSLPHELVFSGVVYLMWSGSTVASSRMASLFDVIMTLELAAAGLLVAAALLPQERMFATIHATARRLYRYAFAIPLWTIVVGGLARILADEVYALSGTVSWDLTPIFVKIEASAIERLQHALASRAMSVFASNFYSAFWLAPLVLIGFVLAAANKPRTLSSLTIAYIVAAVSAVPLFVVFPLFDPWTTNRLYGAIRATTSIQYLVSNPSISALTEINARYHWAAGAAFPSLHVAFPLVTALVLWKHRIRWASWLMGGMSAVSMFVVVYLGRNWIISAVAAVPFAFVVATLEKRIRLNLVLNPHHQSKVVLRPGEVAIPFDPNARAIEWYSGIFLFCAFAAVLSQIAWQRALFNIVGTGVPTAAVLSTAVMFGLAVGFFIGSRVSRRAALSLPTAISGAQLAVGLFGFVSMPLLHLIARATTGWAFAGPAILGFLALLPPTILAGAMIPLLVMNDVRLQRSVGEAVGRIAFAGALGAAAAAAFAALVLFGPLGLTATVQFSAVLNVGIGVLVYVREHRPILKR